MKENYNTKEARDIDWDDPEVKRSLSLLAEAIAMYTKEKTQAGYMYIKGKGWVHKSKINKESVK